MDKYFWKSINVVKGNKISKFTNDALEFSSNEEAFDDEENTKNYFTQDFYCVSFIYY